MLITLSVCLTLFLFGAFHTLVLHELSHCVIVWKNGGKVTSFKPYPHELDTGNTVLASMGYVLNFKDIIKAFKFLVYFYAAPVIRASFFMLLWIGLSFLYRPLLILAFWELLDVANWIKGYFGWWTTESSVNDGKKFKRYYSVSQTTKLLQSGNFKP